MTAAIASYKVKKKKTSCRLQSLINGEHLQNLELIMICLEYFDVSHTDYLVSVYRYVTYALLGVRELAARVACFAGGSL